MKEIQAKMKKSERGSITLFVLVSMMFTTMFLLFAYTSQTNRISEQKKQIAEIQKKYNSDDIESVYNEMQIKEAEKQNEEISLYNTEGEVYSILTISLNPNGGTEYTIADTGSTTIRTIVTVTDATGKELKTLQYAWSDSNVVEPSDWKNFTNGSEVTKTDVTVSGNYYLWVKIPDETGNGVETVRVSNAFYVSK